MSKYIQTNGIRLHYLEFEGDKPTLILMHGLTANAHAFDGLIKAGLSPAFRVLSVDLRGRGLSDKPDSPYTMAEHAKDILGLLDVLQIEKAVLAGHSFGALLSFYLASHYPQRVEKMILIDAAAQMHPNTREMLAPALSRLGQKSPSFEEYIRQIKKAPFLDFWEDTMLTYYEADVQTYEDGSVIPRSKPEHIFEAVNGALNEPWLDYIQGVEHEAILLNATGVYNLDAPLLPKENAMETVNMMKNCHYVGVAGNHQTMLYGQGAKDMVKAIKDFL